MCRHCPRKKSMRRVSGIAAILILSFFSRQLPVIEAQSRSRDNEYDYYALALTSILNSASEASKLPDIPQRVNLLIYAAKTLTSSQQNEAMRLLDIALVDLKKWSSEGTTSTDRRYTASILGNEILALYAQVNPEKAVALQKEFASNAKSSTGGSSEISLKSSSWYSQFSDRSAQSDQLAKIALSLIETDPDKALVLAIQSLHGGTVSGGLYEVFQKLTQSGNRALLNRLEMGIAKALAGNVTLDPHSITYASILILTDKDMSPTFRTEFIRFLMRSLQAWNTVVKEPATDASYITRGFFAFSQNVRPIISQYSPDQLLVFNLILDQAFPLVPEKMRPMVQVIPPESFSDPSERLRDIVKEPHPKLRDYRLVRFVSELLQKGSKDPEDNETRFGLIAEALSNFSDSDAKSAYTNLLMINRIDSLVKRKKFIEAQAIAGSIGSEELRAWALLALARVATKADRVMGFELISNALKALDKASPSPHKVELILMATAMLSESDEQRAFETLSTAARYANSSEYKVSPPLRPAFAFGLDASIGEAHTKLGVFPESLSELKIDSSLSALATTDWFRADSIVNEFREPSLRLRLKLQFAGAVLVKESKLR
jgi:hypothetical protein